MDKEVFLQKYEEVYRDMYRYACLTLGHKEDAEDAVSEAVCDAYRQRDSLKNIDAFRGWIFTILSRKCMAKRKEYATKKTASLDATSEGDPDGVTLLESIPDEGSPGAEGLTVIKGMLSLLDPDDRQIILLHILGGYTSRETGEILGMNDSTVRSREKRALEKLRGAMA